jgi:putative membrane protein
MRSALSLMAFAALLVAASSCGTRESSTESSATSSAPMDQTQQTAVVSDANIAAIVVAANDADIDNARQAMSKSDNAEVKAFAQQMITDHTSVNEKAKELAQRLNLTPEENETSMAMKTGQESMRSTLGAKNGTDFDRAYIDNEVTLHQTVLDAIDQTLLPNAQNAELRQLLTEVRPAIAAHLEHAKQLQTKMGGSAQRM